MDYPRTIHRRGYSVTREQAMVDFKAQWFGLVTFSGSDRERCLVRWTEPRVTCTCRLGRKLYQFLPAFGI